MSRYRRSDNDVGYGDGGPQRWDASRYQRESQYRAAPVIEERPPYGGGPRGSRAPVYEDQRYYEDERYGPRGYSDRRFYEDDEYYDPRAGQGAMIPFRPARPSRPEAPPRPGMIRRQSSLDRFDFDRRPSRRYYDDYRPQPPRAPSPRRYSRYDDVRVQDPEYYGDDGFREYREREWIRSRTRESSPSPDRRTEHSSRRPEVEERRTEIDIKKEEMVTEKPYPRRGKTRMPKRLVHTKVLFDLGYPFYEEDEKTILIEKALGPNNIDEIFAKSKEYRERETITTRLIEMPPPEVGEPRMTEEEIRITQDIRTQSMAEAPRSVREWDQLSSVRSPSPTRTVKSHASRRSRSHVSGRRRDFSPEERETIIEKKTVIERDYSPARSQRTRRRGSSASGSEVIERKIIEKEEFDESNSIAVGPLALVVDRKKSRTNDDINAEIRRLERERKNLRRERESVGGTEIVKIERGRRDSSPGFGELREPSPRGEIIIERRGEDLVEVRKDKRARSRSRPPPSSQLLKAMMFTTT